MTEEEMPEPAKLLSYVLGAAQDLKERKFLAGSVGVAPTPKGIAMFDQIKASGYKPSDIEIANTLMYLCGELDPGILLLFIAYRDGQLKDEDDIHSV